MIDYLEKYITEKIEEIHKRKKGVTEPDFVLYIELKSEIDQEVKNILNKFYKEKKYIIGKTLNDRYIKNKNWDNE